jgi:hypothetical protein
LAQRVTTDDGGSRAVTGGRKRIFSPRGRRVSTVREVTVAPCLGARAGCTQALTAPMMHRGAFGANVNIHQARRIGGGVPPPCVTLRHHPRGPATGRMTPTLRSS